MDYSNKKAQTLTELATFGSILLLVLSFLISYGMRYNYQQDVQMRNFRRALSEAYASGRPDASASIVLLEDKHVPDPRDMFGVGNITPISSQAEVTWGNTLQDKYTDLTDYSTLPRMKYVIKGKEYEYRTAGFGFITSPANQFYVMLPNNPNPQLMTWDKLRCSQPTQDSPKQAMILLNPEAADADKQTEIINEVYLKPGESYIKYKIIGVRTDPPDASEGAPIDRLDLLSPNSGQINPNYTQLNNDVDNDGIPDVTPANLQGLLVDDEQNIKRSGTITIKETSGTSESTSAYSFKNKAGDSSTTITHKIRDNSGVTLPITDTFERGGVPSTWSTPK